MERHNITHHISVNEISDESRSTLRKKTLFSIYIVSYVLVAILFLFFSSNEWTQSFMKFENVKYLKFSFAILYMLMFFPVMFGITYEINKLFFGIRNRMSFYLMLLIGTAYLIIPNLAYLVFYYIQNIGDISSISGQLSDDKVEEWVFIVFVVTLSCITTALIIVNFILIKNNHIHDLKQIISLFAITFMSFFGIFSIVFIGLLKSWLIILYFFMITSLSDTFAYLGGMLFGRHKIAPLISPKKTWEGFGFGLFLTTCTGLLVYLGIWNDNYAYSWKQLVHFNYFIVHNSESSWWFVTILIISLSISGSCGDLFYSYMKRLHKVKDYSDLLREHGGILDRFDSALIAFSLYTIALFFLTAITSDTLWNFSN